MEFRGSNYFRFRLALSLISGKAITIKSIRENKKGKPNGEEENEREPTEGLHEYEAKLLRLIDKLCDDTIIKINEDGNELYFKPGFLIGNVKDEVRIGDLNISFHCGKERSITYFLEFLLMIVPFFKNPVKLLLKGITDDYIDATVYTCKMVSENFFKNFLKVNENFLNITILKRGIKSDCSGEVLFFMNNLKMINSFDMYNAGFVNKITGSIICNKISPVFRNKLMNFAKKNLYNFTPYINIEIEKENNSNNNNHNNNNLENNFISFSLFAHTQNRCIYGTDLCIDKIFLQHVKDLLNTQPSGYHPPVHRTPGKASSTEGAGRREEGWGEVGWGIDHEETDEGEITDAEEVDKEEADEEEADEEEADEDEADEEDEYEDDEANGSPKAGASTIAAPRMEKSFKQISDVSNKKSVLHVADIYERLGFFISLKMMNEIKGLSSVDTNYQWLPLIYMALANDTAVSKISLTVLKPYAIALIRLLRDFFNVVFDIKKVEKSQVDYSYVIECVGIGYRNFSKKTF
ncbi:RNA 3'-terminal phosphate cyclase-like protein, putative [Plasmodium ovale]|uniref:RNA 3'-terminal phosphate cyclase-like protein, putative n=2 Tax=Plasmodium ovale TaxID=36330 RepID=A0A1A8WWE4_PLAOA|nr:RNA 3'-terminal phosphate cyclase-like protein, putative [Plasmodium ovale curtisi]SBS96672.1 RNA 3'-terminal phosphate cyclase-like protein, putative [Plasmodium ovale curtisi]SCP05572.1 RNA 3'-terminal phosphate cyclase-like protein, putative [Plasmodium ovale]